MKTTSFLAGALLAAAPLVVLTIPGCGGGDSGFPFPTATPTTTPTTTGTPTGTTTPTTSGTANPTATSGATQTSNLTLGNGQRAVLRFNQNGTNINGTLQILASTTTMAMRAKPRAINFNITVGTYTFTGTVTPPRGYSIQGNLGTFGAFSMNGQLPTATQAGSYTLSVNGQTDSGTLPAIGQTFPTPTPTGSGSNYRLSGSLAISNVTSGGDILTTSISSFNNNGVAGQLTNNSSGGKTFQIVSLNGSEPAPAGNGTTRTIGIGLTSYASITDLKPFSVGQTIVPNIALGNLLQISQSVVQGTSVKTGVWRSASGSIIVKAIGTNSISLELKNVQFDPTPIVGGKGSFTVNGTVTATGLTVQNN